MSWSSRLGWSGRWSPFGARGDNTNEVTEQDYSYINPDDLDPPSHNTTSTTTSSTHNSTSSTTSRPPRDTDVLIFRHKTTRYPVHFPAYSISDGQLTIGAARDHAARKLEVADPRRIRMFHKGRNLKDNSLPCRDEGLRSEDASQEILCVVGEGAASPGAEADSGSDSDSLDAAGSDPAAVAAKKKRNRSSRKKRSNKKPSSATATPPPEYLPVPANALPQTNSAGGSSTSTPRARSPAPPPLTPLAKLEALGATFRATFVPQCIAFTERPPAEAARREFEHKKLTETILAQVLLKLDAVETEGDEEARGKRKELVREVQGMLNRLDAVMRV